MGKQTQVGGGTSGMAAEACLNMWGIYQAGQSWFQWELERGQVSEVCLWLPGLWPRLLGAYL